jgi:hypothetical protein
MSSRFLLTSYIFFVLLCFCTFSCILGSGNSRLKTTEWGSADQPYFAACRFLLANSKVRHLTEREAG